MSPSSQPEGAPAGQEPGAPGPGRLAAWVAAMSHGLLQRDAAVRLALLAALAGEHVLLVGPPGTAKSALARRLHRAFSQAPYFERLLTRFSTPEELFGPLSLKSLEDDRYERLTAGFLPTAGIAFLDEVFKANSAILNALLTLLNEREFDNGSGRLLTPLISVVGASNELPADESLQAFFDRFLLRVPVQPVDDSAFADLLQLEAVAAESPAWPLPITDAERQALRHAASRVTLGSDALQACMALRKWLVAQGLVVSDRRWRQWVGLMRMAAASEGRREVDVLDLWLAPYVVGADAGDVQRVARWFAFDVLDAQPREAPWLGRAVQAFEKQLELEQSARDDAETGGAAGKLALARAIGRGDPDGPDGGDALRLESRALQEQLRRRYSPVHVAARVAQLDEVLAHARHHLAEVDAQAQALARRVAGRLWLPPAEVARWQSALASTREGLQALCDRLRATRAGFAALKVEDGLDDAAPPALPVDAVAERRLEPASDGAPARGPTEDVAPA